MQGNIFASLTNSKPRKNPSCLGGLAALVKFQARWMKKRYKRNQEYRYKRYSIDFPTWLNEKIEPHMHKNFSVDFAARETSEQEIINITLMRKKQIE